MPTLAHPPIHQAWPSNAWRRYGEYYLKLTPTVTGLLRNDTADSFVSRRLGLCLFSAGLEVQTRYPPGLLVIRHSHGGGLGPKAIHHPEAGGQTFCPPQSPASPMKSTVSQKGELSPWMMMVTDGQRKAFFFPGQSTWAFSCWGQGLARMPAVLHLPSC